MRNKYSKLPEARWCGSIWHMAEFTHDMLRFLNLCWNRFKRHRLGFVMVILAILLSCYSLIRNFAPLVDWGPLTRCLPALPKLPLPWFAIVILIALLIVLVVGGSDLIKPKFEIVFYPGREPFVREEIQSSGRKARYFRVGIRAKGLSSIHNCRLVLDEISPLSLKGEPGIHVGHAFQVMGIVPPQERFEILPSGESPYHYIDIVCEDLNDHTIYLTYAAPVYNQIARLGQSGRVVQLKLTGEDSAAVSKWFVLYEHSNTRELVFEPWNPPSSQIAKSSPQKLGAFRGP